ncbi:hypothetical protein PLESTB_000192300 [Pleodorina starrii]|uniref:N-alpha-acetyltransferase 60 n=1 Tax=Pleodorina starrii TaxID=330485 RepID=A0A9W6BCM0_9CHLO|nr:hypothetical protein PLESTB_000192300 [Pleodorina starrii]
MFGPSFGGSPGSPPTTLLFQGQPPLNLHYRPLQQSDYDALKEIHRDLFPIDYEEVFFRKAIGGEDRVFSWAALHNEYGRDHLVGFVTARLVYLYECDPMDRQVMGLTSKCLDGEGAVYVLTLGVVSSCRQCGIARSLLGLVQQHAARVRCRAIFLHVISYNDAAMRLYGGSGYQAMARLPNFYHLITGRQPNPEQSWYDAFLYALFIPHSGPEPSAAMQWAGGMLGAAVAPLRSVLGTFHGCIPSWFCRQTYSTFLPFAAGGGAAAVAASQRSASKGSLADTATSAWQQQQQQHAPPWQAPALALPPSSQSQAQSQQPLPVSNPAGVVCAGVTAEHFLRRGGSQHQPQHHPHPQPHPQQQPYAHPPSCNGGQRHPKDLGASSQVTVAGGGSGAGPGPHSQQQQQQPYNKGSMSYGLDSVGGGGGGGGGSSAASSGSVSGEAAHPQLGTAPPTLQPLSRQPHPQPLLRPPSPPIPPNLAPSMTSLQQRHPHHGGSSGASTPSHAGGGGPNGHHRSHHGQHHHQHQHHQHYHQQQGSNHGGQYGVGGGSGGPGAHGRNGEHSRGGIHRGSPQGMAGGGLYPAGNPSQWQQQPQQSGGSVLAMLFRPPTAQQHPHSR